MFTQVRVDHGKEFYMTLYMQEKQKALREKLNIKHYVQTKHAQVRLSLMFTVHVFKIIMYHLDIYCIKFNFPSIEPQS